MSPLEKLLAVANRLFQEGESQRGAIENRLKADAASIRCAVATIRNALEARGTKGRHAKFDLIVGDDSGSAS